jgi:NAD(P)-dependent dehydrogenase (short-subunit alcohol dehydrogenase family)
MEERSLMPANTILITGASTGFGRDTAKTLKRGGHTVFASMREPRGRNREHAEALRRQGIEVIELDVRDDAAVERAVRSMLDKAGRIDVLVNNAGIASAGVTEAFTSDQALALFDVNVFGVLRVTRAVLPCMRRQRRGLIINIGSVLGRVTFPFFGIYGASKFAVEALSDSQRYELSQLGIEVVLVQPSAYPTPMYASMQQPADKNRTAEYGKIGEIPGALFEHFSSMFQSPAAPNPHDVADAIAKLVAQPRGSRAARTVVGAAFGADSVNDHAAQVQAQVITALGLGHLATIA